MLVLRYLLSQEASKQLASSVVIGDNPVKACTVSDKNLGGGSVNEAIVILCLCVYKHTRRRSLTKSSLKARRCSGCLQEGKYLSKKLGIKEGEGICFKGCIFRSLWYYFGNCVPFELKMWNVMRVWKWIT